MNIVQDFSIGKYFTFDPSKGKPIYNWFYYKEAFSPEVVDYVLDSFAPGAKIIYDPFCGAGTSVLRAKERGISSFAVDSSPLAVFVSRVKCADYSESDIAEIKKFLGSFGNKIADSEHETRNAEPISSWDFELFPPRIAFPRSNLNSIMFIRQQLESVENQNAANFLMLALLSILPQTSLVVKDGGVLKIDKKKRAMPAKEAFRRKVKGMLTDMEGAKGIAIAHAPGCSIPGLIPDIRLGDSRKTEFESESADIIVTSPPYLNNIDYSKIYGLELSLLALNKRITAETRARSVRSFISGDSFDASELSQEVRDFADKIPIVGSYFSDIRAVLVEMHRILRPGGIVGFVVGNSVIHETHILVDEIIAEMAESDGVGFSSADIVVGLERIADVRPRKVKTRESIIIMRK